MIFNRIISLAVETEAASESASLSKALLNTVMGITIVFLALLLICFIISLFKLINKAQAKDKKAAPVQQVSEPTIVAAAESEPEQTCDDGELIAAITAAIYAFEAENNAAEPSFYAADGLFIRSIRKVNKRKAIY